jgi:aspartate 1-decarboxylase
MLNTYLKAKVQAIKITDRKLDYEGSLTLDEDIMDELNVHPYEQVFVNSKYFKSRIMTYVLPGKRGSKCCEVNGGAVHHFHNGEIVHLLFFTQSSEPIKPIVL